ncbi:MAG: DUF4423 domain-containing protein [Myxococcota bacterium]
MPVRYSGNDYREFLRALLKDRGLLQRDLAERMDRSPAWASQILNGRRRLQRELAERIADVLLLDDAERWDLLHLVDLSASPSPAIQRRMPPADPHGMPLDRWYVDAIRELMRCEDVQSEPAWIAAALRPRISEEEAREALQALQERNLLDDAPSPRRGIRSTDRQATQVLQLALDSLLSTPPNVRRHLTGSVAMSEETYQQFLTALQALLTTLLQSPASTETPNRVYQVSLAVFPVSLYTDSAAHPSDVE